MKLRPPIAPTTKPVKKPASVRTAKNSSLITVNDATAFLHCHRVTLLRLIRRGRLQLLKTGSRWSFLRAEIDALANRNIAVYPHLTVVRPSK